MCAMWQWGCAGVGEVAIAPVGPLFFICVGFPEPETPDLTKSS